MAGKISSILELIKSKIVDKLTSKKCINSYLSSNSFILSIYYNFGMYMFFFISCSIFYNVFTTDTILCTDGMARGAASIENKKLPFLFENYCLSYPKLNNTDEFALFYKWVPWICTLSCVLLYTPKILINNSSCKFIALHLMKINNLNDERYYEFDEKKSNKKNGNNQVLNNNNNNNYDNQIKFYIKELIEYRWNKCKDLYWKSLFVHIYSFCLNIFLILILDFLLQGRFLFYVLKTIPFKRNITNFSDEMSQTFYPFSTCTIQHVLLGRTEHIVCHLTMMEYYEKIFFIIWLYLYILPIFTFMYILYLASLFRRNYNCFFEFILKNSLNFNLIVRYENILNRENYAKIV